MTQVHEIKNTKAIYHSDVIDENHNAHLSAYLDAYGLIHIGQTTPQGFDANTAYKLAQELTYMADLASGRMDEMVQEFSHSDEM